MQQLLLLISLFLVILIGFLAGKYKILDENASKYFNKFVFYIAVPASTLISISGISHQEFQDLKKFILVTLIIQLILFFSLILLFKVLGVRYQKKFVLVYSMVAGNNLYFGLPILLSLFGQEYYRLGMIYALTVITIPEAILYFIIQRAGDVNGKATLKSELIRLITIPLVMATIVGLALFTTKIALPATIYRSLDILGKSISALALISMGLTLAHNFKYNFTDIKLNLLTSFVKLMVVPAFILLLVKYLFPISHAGIITSIIQGAMPSAVFTIVLADLYQLDKKLAAGNVLVSSILALASVSFWVWVVGKI
ncbi:MAG: AEC family transporter [bacterium]